MVVGKIQWIFVTLILVLDFHKGFAQLQVEYINRKLPSVLHDAAIFYDGDDSIYLFGGTDGNLWTNKTYQFNVSSETLQNIGAMPNNGLYGGSIHPDNLGNMFFMRGDEGENVVKYDPIGNKFTVVATNPYHLIGSDSVKFNNTSNIVYIFGGGANGTGIDIFKFDMDTYHFQWLGSLPRSIYPVNCVNVAEKAYLFGGSGLEDDNESVSLVDLETLDVYESPPLLPAIVLASKAVVAGDYIYTIGGYYPEFDFSTDGIIQVDPGTLQTTFLHVDGFPVGITNDTYFQYAPATVFVEKLNRIYFFGGRVGNTTSGSHSSLNDIWFINLDPLETTTTTSNPDPGSTTTMNPDIFSCVNRIDGTYPHPLDCAKFIGCLEQEMEVYTCPPPLLFNPLNRHGCEWPDRVNCELHCVDREDGNYPHPHDCSLFIVCYGGLLDAFKCPPPLLFDPELKECWFPNMVNCTVPN